LSIDNIIDIYSERLEDEQILESLREILSPRLEHIEAEIGKSEDPGQIISYRMEVHSIYTAGIVGKEFAEERLNKDIGKFRLMANEANIIVENGFFPPSNMFFMETLDPLERKDLIDGGHIDTNMIKNRMQNSDLSEEEREILEEYI
jgi:hypothetical protein